ncbi:MAG: hypothetical protein ACRC67_30185 [Inquilinus sp.]|uniref:hypothetical protein n=1 Tax=Inquilinus sp. TaxID=1932117 RepID=UPI003F2B7BD1
MIGAFLSGLGAKAWGYIAAAGAALLAAAVVVGQVLAYGRRKRAEGSQQEKGKQDAAAAKQNRDMLHAPRVRDRDDLADRLRGGEF